jgi:hypothetical protein
MGTYDHSPRIGKEIKEVFGVYFPYYATNQNKKGGFK